MAGAAQTAMSCRARTIAAAATRTAGALARLGPGGDALGAFPRLTERERELLGLLASGLTSGEIAARLFLSEKTVRNVVSTVFAEREVSSRAEAVAKARDAGLGGAAPGHGRRDAP